MKAYLYRFERTRYGKKYTVYQVTFTLPKKIVNRLGIENDKRLDVILLKDGEVNNLIQVLKEGIRKLKELALYCEENKNEKICNDKNEVLRTIFSLDKYLETFQLEVLTEKTVPAAQDNT